MLFHCVIFVNIELTVLPFVWRLFEAAYRYKGCMSDTDLTTLSLAKYVFQMFVCVVRVGKWSVYLLVKHGVNGSRLYSRCEKVGLYAQVCV